MIGTAAAILGAGVLSAGAGVLGASKAAKASQQAADENAAVNREIYQQTRTDLSPYAQGGVPAVSALQQRMGLTSPAPSASRPAAAAQYSTVPIATMTGPPPAGTAPLASYGAAPASVNYAANKAAGGSAGTSPGTPIGEPPPPPPTAAPSGHSPAEVLSLRPDVAAEYQQESTRDAKSQANLAAMGIHSAEDFAAWWQKTYGVNEGLPPQATPTTDAGTAPGPTGPQSPTDLITARRPDAMPPPTFGEAPQFGFSAEDFKQSPGYAWARDEALRGANAGYGARRLLKSSAAVKGIMGRAEGLASQEYNNWFGQQQQRQAADRGQYNADRAYGSGLWDTQQNRQDNIFSQDRGFQAGRYDQDTANLFGLANIGQSAAAGQANAGNAFAQAQTANNNMAATNTGNAALTAANMFSNTLGQGVQAYGYLKGGKF